MRISSKADYAIRAVVELAALDAELVKTETIATAQDIPPKFLVNILFELKRAGIVASQRGADGGYRLGRPATTITLADVIRAVEGPLAQVGDYRPDELSFHGSAEPLLEVWIAVRENLRAVLEEVTIADVAAKRLPAHVRQLAAKRDAWMPHLAGAVPGAAALRAGDESKSANTETRRRR